MTVTWDQGEVERRIREGALRGVHRAGLEIEEKATIAIQSPPKSGRKYRRRGVVHQASAPGQPPASDTGRLVQSSEVRLDPVRVSATVNWSAAYAPPLELGTEKMAPRPFARPALNDVAPSLEGYVAQGIRESLAS